MCLPRVLRPILLLLLVLTGPRALATTAAEVCTGDPCVLNKAVDVTPGSVLDFGNRAFRMDQAARLSTGEGDTLVIIARSVTMQQGALIRGPLVPSAGITVRIQATQDILIQRSGLTRARIDAHGQANGGFIDLEAGRNVDLAGELRVDGTTADADGGTVEITAAGAMTMTGEILASGGLAAGGGTVEIGTGAALVTAAIDASSGLGDGGIELTAGTTLTTTGALSVAGRSAGSSGGQIALDANGSILVGARIGAQADGSIADGGIGGDIDIASGTGSVRLNERIEVYASGGSSGAGSVAVTAGADITVAQPILAHGASLDGDGGDVDLLAGGALTMNALIDAHGLAGGRVSARGGTGVQAGGEINAAGTNGDIFVFSLSVGGAPLPGPVMVAGNLHANAPSAAASGIVTVQGCDVTVAATGRIGTAGANALNHLRSSRQISVAGQVVAGPPGTNRFEFRNPPNLTPTIAGGAVVDPPAAFEPSTSPTLLPCTEAPPPPVCGNGMTESGESCDDGNTAACDGCSTVCAQEGCGNGMVECTEAVPPGCDDGNVTDGDGCDANCTVTACGNGRVTGTEQCDDGNTTTGDGCDAACQIEAPTGCGNGMTEADLGEECDDSNTNDCDGCSRTCRTESCGNNRVECAEVCDSGNALDCDGDGCASTCLTEEICGDGTTQCQEQCDEGASNSQPGVGCNSQCRLCTLGSGDCPCGGDTDCHELGKCGGLACVDGLCASVPPPTCNDGNACNGAETCADGACVVGTPLQCADADPCTVDACDPGAGCQHAIATGFAAVSCRVEAFRLALDAASPDQVPAALRQKLDKASAKLQDAADAAANGGDNAKRLKKLLKKVERRAKKVLSLVRKGERKSQLPAALAESLRSAAEGARSAAEGIRRGLTT